MKTYIRRRERNDQLIVLFAGWGCDEHLFIPLLNDDFDYLLFFHYSADEALVLPEMKQYRKITLIAWSLGVWAAEYMLAKTGIDPDLRIAVNGTPFPADDKYGIPLRIFEGTLNNINEENMNKFYFRMFGDKKTNELNREMIPHRTLKSLHDELRWLYNRMMEHTYEGFRWDFAVTSEIDRVFPAENVNSYWAKEKKTKHIILPVPHYFFNDWKSLTEFIDYVEAYGKKRSARRVSKSRQSL
jgi:biotin synthesis protein BioG